MFKYEYSYRYMYIPSSFVYMVLDGIGMVIKLRDLLYKLTMVSR